MENFGVQIG